MPRKLHGDLERIELRPWLRSEDDPTYGDAWDEGFDLARSLIMIVDELRDMVDRDKWVHGT